MAKTLKAKPSRPRRRSSSKSSRPSRSAPIAAAVEPFDLEADTAQRVRWSGLTLQHLQQSGAEAMVARVTRGLAAEFRNVPENQRPALRAAAIVGYLMALLNGLQLGAAAIENWRGQLIEMAGRSFEFDQLNPEGYGFILGLLSPERNLILPEKESLIH